jgi:hypothetical protein
MDIPVFKSRSKQEAKNSASEELITQMHHLPVRMLDPTRASFMITEVKEEQMEFGSQMRDGFKRNGEPDKTNNIPANKSGLLKPLAGNISPRGGGYIYIYINLEDMAQPPLDLSSRQMAQASTWTPSGPFSTGMYQGEELELKRVEMRESSVGKWLRCH